MLEKKPRDLQVWCLKVRALTSKNWIDDTEIEEEGVAEVLLDENAMASAPRPGTSLSRPLSSAGRSGSAAMRPLSSAGRPLSGYARPRTGSRGGTASGAVEGAFQGSRPGTSRPVTASGRFVRLGTASIISEGGAFLDVDRLDFRKYVKRPALSKALCDYILYHDHNPRKALELCALATQESEFKDWWWKARLGKCYYQLGLYREAEAQFKSSLKIQDMIPTYLELCKVYLRIDQPNTALRWYTSAADNHPTDTHLRLGIARVYDLLNDVDSAVEWYHKILQLDSTNIESLACLAANHFYEDHPEVALRLYRRIMHMGVMNTELWTNMALCCFYASQYDLALNCFEKALVLASDDNMSDVWYNIGIVAIGIGDLSLAYQAFSLAVSVDPKHAEAFNNLGVLDLRRGNLAQAKANFQTASQIASYLHEPSFNTALLSSREGEFQEAFTQIKKSLSLFSEHADSKELSSQLETHFTSL